jgi:hypothetical protein
MRHGLREQVRHNAPVLVFRRVTEGLSWLGCLAANKVLPPYDAWPALGLWNLAIPAVVAHDEPLHERLAKVAARVQDGDADHVVPHPIGPEGTVHIPVTDRSQTVRDGP